MEKREWKEAEDTFKELRQEAGSKNDTYAVMAQGAIPLNSLSGIKRKVQFFTCSSQKRCKGRRFCSCRA